MQTLLRRKAQTDSLTGLKNKSTTEELCRTCLEHAQGDICALFILDLDNFKHINDEGGIRPVMWYSGPLVIPYTNVCGRMTWPDALAGTSSCCSWAGSRMRTI